MQINNKTFLVTGGASGLGAAVAEALGNRSGNVVLADMNEDSGQLVASRIGSNARFISTNVCDEQSAMKAIEFAISEFGTVDGLVNCAGIAPGEKILGRTGVHTLDAFAKTVNVNLVGSFNMLRLAAAKMALNDEDATERGVIVNTASIAAYEGQIGQTAYAAS
jgi:NAD(P)-dependent dehydrogenase (short-subunit alcohol dehydrogenase family)